MHADFLIIPRYNSAKLRGRVGLNFGVSESECRRESGYVYEAGSCTHRERELCFFPVTEMEVDEKK